MVKILGDIILSSWLWQFTSDWFHPVVTGIVMFFIMRIALRRSRIQSLVMSFCAQIFALTLLSLIAIGVLVHMFQWEFDQESLQYAQIVFFNPTLSLGVLYALFQTFFFLLVSFFWSVGIWNLIIACWISNGLGVMISYLCIKFVELTSYTG